MGLKITIDKLKSIEQIDESSIMRNPFFDILKGYAIFLVVLGHAIQCFYPNWERNELELFIYSFHMPLFIAVSGYFFLNFVKKKTPCDFLKSKFQHLMIPSLTIGTINAVIYGGGKLYIHSEIDYFHVAHLVFVGLWFLVVLFLLSVIGYAIHRSLQSRWTFVCWIVLFTILYFCPDLWVLHQLKYLTPFFVCSIYLSKYSWEKTPIWLLGISSIIFICLLMHYDFSKSMYRMDDNIFTLQHFLDYIFRFSIGLFGCVASILICKIVSLTTYLKKMLCYTGTLTLPIYVLHQKLIEWNLYCKFEIRNMILLILISISLCIITIYTYKILKRNRLFSYLLFGEKP